MLRQTHELTLTLDRPASPEVTAAVPQQRVSVKVRPDGRVRARLRDGEVPPVFVGRVEETPEGPALQGVVRESAGALCAPLSFAVLAVVALVVTVWAVLAGSLTNAMVAGMSAIVLSIVSWAVRQVIRSGFEARARALSGELATAAPVQLPPPA